MEESLAFYMDAVGLAMDRRFRTGDGREIAFLGDGETKVELISGSGSKINAGSGISLGFTVDSIKDKMKSLGQMGIGVAEGPYRPNPSIEFFYVLDPNGVRIQFVENL